MEQSEYHGFLRLDFEYQGREVIVVCPKQRAAGNPWVWRAEFFGAFDTVDVEMVNRMCIRDRDSIIAYDWGFVSAV